MVGDRDCAVSSGGDKGDQSAEGGGVFSQSSSTSSMGGATTASSAGVRSGEELMPSDRPEEGDRVGRGSITSHGVTEDAIPHNAEGGEGEVISSPALCDFPTVSSFLENRMFEVEVSSGKQSAFLTKKGQEKVFHRVKEFFNSSGGDVRKASNSQVLKVLQWMVDEFLKEKFQQEERGSSPKITGGSFVDGKGGLQNVAEENVNQPQGGNSSTPSTTLNRSRVDVVSEQDSEIASAGEAGEDVFNGEEEEDFVIQFSDRERDTSPRNQHFVGTFHHPISKNIFDKVSILLLRLP